MIVFEIEPNHIQDILENRLPYEVMFILHEANEEKYLEAWKSLRMPFGFFKMVMGIGQVNLYRMQTFRNSDYIVENQWKISEKTGFVDEG